MAPSSPLFDALVKVCGLSPLFARNSMARALARAGVDATTLTKAELARALPEIKQAILPFLDGDVDTIMARIEWLTKT